MIHGELQLRQIHGEEKAARRQSRSGGQGWKGMVEEGAGLTPDACSLPVFLLNHTKFLFRVERQGNTIEMVDNAKLGSSPSSQMVAFVIVIVWMEQPSSECQRPNSLSAVIILQLLDR